MRVHRLLAAVLAVLAVGLAACSSPAPETVSSTTARKAIELGGNWAWQKQAADLELGVTHTENSLDDDEPSDARKRGEAILSDDGAVWQNVHLMGFGTLNPEPSPGDYDWSSLDTRMQLVKDTGGRTVLTLCCSPDWMKGGQDGQTDWSKIEVAPQTDHYDDFAALAAAAVKRYPQVERVVVWNELKGFYNDDQNRWDYESYTQLYNKVYQAVKGARSDVQVGGPYAVLSSLDPGSENSSDLKGPWGVADQRALDIVTYWLANNAGADFLTLDASTSTRSDTLPSSIKVGAQKYADLAAWIHKRTDLPIWWSEFYPDVPKGADAGPSSRASAAADLASVAAMAQSGASGALLWGPQGDSDLKFASLWTDSTDSDGGQPTPLTPAWQWLVPRLAKGDVEIGYSSTMPLLAFRAPDGVLVVNLTGRTVTVQGADPLPAWASAITTSTT